MSANIFNCQLWVKSGAQKRGEKLRKSVKVKQENVSKVEFNHLMGYWCYCLGVGGAGEGAYIETFSVEIITRFIQVYQTWIIEKQRKIKTQKACKKYRTSTDYAEQIEKWIHYIDLPTFSITSLSAPFLSSICLCDCPIGHFCPLQGSWWDQFNSN